MTRETLIALTSTVLLAACSASGPEPYGPVPSEAQLAWQRMEINMFCHFGPNTFTGAEWGSGEESVEVFAPTALDCRQWVDVARQAGMGGIILTAKHHDGFCLWPSQFSTHTVGAGNNDVLRQFTDACREGGMKAGVYISPWDRNHPSYGTPEYNTFFANTLHEVHTTYGPFFEQWFDGACGEGPNGKRQEYDWPLFESTVTDINPQCVMFSDVGPGCRWVGNEQGHCGDPCWSTLNTEGATPSDNKPQPTELETGHQNGTHWVPAEVDVSIRPGWFWHATEHPKTVDELMEIYYNSVGRNGLLLLNVPPDDRGLIPAEDSAVLVAFRAERDRIFSHDLTEGAVIEAYVGDGIMAASKSRQPTSNLTDTSYHTYWMLKGDDTRNIDLKITLPEEREFDIVMLQEYIPLGQRVTQFHISYSFGEDMGGSWVASGTTIGYKRIIRLPHPIRTHTLFITIDHSLAPPILNRIALYNTQAQ